MSRFAITGKHVALAAVWVCAASVLVLMGANIWLIAAIGAAFGAAWSLAEIVVEMTVQEIRGRRNLRQAKATYNGPSFEFTSSRCTAPVNSSEPGLLTSCEAPSVPGAHHCSLHLRPDLWDQQHRKRVAR